MSNCKGCGHQNPPMTPGSGRKRKFCSKKCAKTYFNKKARARTKLVASKNPPGKCKWCEGPTEAFASGGAKKYCSRECCSKFNDRGAKSKAEIEQHDKWIHDHCIPVKDLAKDLGITVSALSIRANKLGIKKHRWDSRGSFKKREGTVWSWIEKAHIDLISYTEDPPPGWLNRAAAAKILNVDGFTMCTAWFKRHNVSVKRQYRQLSSKRIAFFKEEDILTLKAKLLKDAQPRSCPGCGVYFKLTRRENGQLNKSQVYCSSECLYVATGARRIAEQLARQEVLDKYIVDNNLTYIQNLADAAGVSTSFIRHHFDVEKKHNRLLVNKDLLPAIKKRYEDSLNRERADYVIRRNDNWQDWAAREERLISSFSRKIKLREEKYGKGSTIFNSIMNAVNNTLAYHSDRIHKGIVKKFPCKKCGVSKEFYEFEFQPAGKGRSLKRCLKCRREKNRREYDSARTKKNRQKNYRGRIRTMVTGSVRGHINKINKNYRVNASGFAAEVWEAIEKQCGYDHNDLCDHIEKLFNDKMNWNNQTTPKKPGEYGWHLDHIIAHNSFSYDSLDHPDFAKCWALTNLRPIGAIKNLIKGDKDLYSEFRRTFNTGVKLAIKGKSYDKGIWRFLEYDNFEAKKNIEKKFKKNMKWNNWGKFWQLDHIDPMAHLAHTSHNDKNFKKCWTLNNLNPILAAENRSKNSKWQNTYWYHNY